MSAAKIDHEAAIASALVDAVNIDNTGLATLKASIAQVHATAHAAEQTARLADEAHTANLIAWRKLLAAEDDEVTDLADVVHELDKLIEKSMGLEQ